MAGEHFRQQSNMGRGPCSETGQGDPHRPLYPDGGEIKLCKEKWAMPSHPVLGAEDPETWGSRATEGNREAPWA